ncbi:MAG: ribbon-helix-helix domain-containing protein [Patescibacteria group bacterium]
MRDIINISMPAEMVKDVNMEIKKGNFASKSEFFRHLLRMWNTQKLAEELKREQREFRKGNYKVLHSLKNLK